MKQAPLQLLDYWVSYIEVRANGQFDHQKPADLDIDSIVLQSGVHPREVTEPEVNGTEWLVHLRIEQPLGENKNIPYSYTLEITGVVAVHPVLQGDKLRRAIEVNGPSMLFGSAREILRAATGRGPFAPIIIPSTDFFSRLPKEPAELPASEPGESQKQEDKDGDGCEPRPVEPSE